MSGVCVSGGFSVLHRGHLSLLFGAKVHGDVTVILNSDAWLKRKYGKVIMPWEMRASILMATGYVHEVVRVKDADGTVCEALRRIRPDSFANGGDRTKGNTPEMALCAELGIKPVFNVGGGKVASSSEMLRAHA